MRLRRTTPVSEFMSRLPEEIDRRATLADAMLRMREKRVRHLPVMDGAHVFGILSRSDVHDAWMEHGSAAVKQTVEDVCMRDLLVVTPVTPVCEVADQMVLYGVTSALVMESDVLVGVFSSFDALRALAAHGGLREEGSQPAHAED